MKSIISLLSLICLLLALCLAGCKNAHGPAPGRTITVSIAPLSGMAAAIAGEQFGVSTLMPEGMSPETYELTPGRVLELGNSSLLLRVGSLGFEQTLTERLGGAMPATRIVSLGNNIEKLEDKACDHASGEDPHLWMSPRNMQTMADKLCQALCETDTANAPAYRAATDRYKAHLDSVAAEVARRLSPATCRTFLIHHPALGYFARDFGLRQIAVERNGKEPSPRQLQQIAQMCRAEGVRVVFVSREHSVKTARRIAETIGAKVVEINPLSANIEEEWLKIADAMQQPPTP